ncbi:MAG: SGNH/GDSL hydrolase family protein [Verrucomicrobiota bacterium]
MNGFRIKNLAKNLAVSLASLALCFLLLELILRFLGYGNVELYESDPVLYWKLKPNQQCYTKVDRKPVRINSHGTRGPEFLVPKPDQTVRIVSLGDSKTFGWGLTESEAYSGLLEQLLQKKAGNRKKIEVLNAGVNAWSYPQMLAYFRDYALQYDPDVVVLADANLWTQFSERNSAKFVAKFMWRVRLKNLLRRFATYHYIVEVKLKEFYERYRTKFIPVDPQNDALFKEQQQKDPEAFFRTAIEDLCQLAQQKHVQPILVYIPTLDELAATNQSMVLKAKRSVSRKFKVPLLDLTPDLAGQGKSLYLEADPVHLNAPGNEIIARRLFETMTNLLSL